MVAAKEEQWAALPLGQIMQQVGAWFLGEPYVAGTLDQSKAENLVVKLNGFDCVTFVETVLALARVIENESYDFGRFRVGIESQRYRGGRLDGYCSRMHYFSEWIYDNERRGHVENMTPKMGGVELEKTLDFMTSHRSSYPQIAENDSLYHELSNIENKLKDLKLYYIPQQRIRSVYGKLQAGDILALATDIEGLDVVHTGLAYRHEDGRMGLLHASTTRGVTVSSDLQRYVENNKRQIGIVVARPKSF